jgi:hypothetical protein
VPLLPHRTGGPWRPQVGKEAEAFFREVDLVGKGTHNWLAKVIVPNEDDVVSQELPARSSAGECKCRFARAAHPGEQHRSAFERHARGVHGVAAPRAQELEQTEGKEEARGEMSCARIVISYEDARGRGRGVAERGDPYIDEPQHFALRVVVELVFLFEQSPRPTHWGRHGDRRLGVRGDLDDDIGRAFGWIERAEARGDTFEEP